MSSIAHWRRQFKPAVGRSQSVQAILATEAFERRCRDCGHRWRRSFWSPRTTFVCCLLQALSAAKTLRAAVSDLLVELVERESSTELPSADPSAFTQGRKRLPEAAFETTFRETVSEVRRLASDERVWCGRRVRRRIRRSRRR